MSVLNVSWNYRCNYAEDFLCILPCYEVHKQYHEKNHALWLTFVFADLGYYDIISYIVAGSFQFIDKQLAGKLGQTAERSFSLFYRQNNMNEKII